MYEAYFKSEDLLSVAGDWAKGFVCDINQVHHCIIFLHSRRYIPDTFDAARQFL